MLKGYAQVGTYTVTLTVTDQSGRSNSTTSTVRIVLPNQVPTANAGGPYSGAIGTLINFNGSASSDPLGQVLSYSWSFGDGGTATGIAPTHTYSSPGSFTVTLTVTHTSGVSATATTKANIAYPSPTIKINGPYSGKPTLAIAFTSMITEPYDNSFSYQWSFGDGSSATVANPTHAYAAAGTYSVSLTAIGQYGETATATSSATITAQTSTGSFSGTVESGSAPISGAHVHLFAANTTGYGQASVSLLSNTGLTDSAVLMSPPPPMAPLPSLQVSPAAHTSSFTFTRLEGQQAPTRTLRPASSLRSARAAASRLPPSLRSTKLQRLLLPTHFPVTQRRPHLFPRPTLRLRKLASRMPSSTLPA